MDKAPNFTQDELQLLYAACLSYADKLIKIHKSIPDEGKNILDNLSGRATESWELAQKITRCMEDTKDV